MKNTKYGKRRIGRWTPIRAKAQDTRANPNSWETHLVRKRLFIGLLQALSPRIMMMMSLCKFDVTSHETSHETFDPLLVFEIGSPTFGPLVTSNCKLMDAAAN